MSQKREKKRRRKEKEVYRWYLERWHSWEPPRWRFISHWIWKKRKPVPPKGLGG